MLYKYLSDKSLYVLKDLKIRFTQPFALNDPFEALPLIDAESEQEKMIERAESEIRDLWKKCDDSDRTPKNYELLKSTLESQRPYFAERLCPSVIGQEFMKKINEVLGVLSLTKSADNLLMWSHYANEHRGYVLGLNDTHEFFYRTALDGSESSPRNVIYTSQRSRVNIKKHDYYERLLCEKPIHWSYEEEVRLFHLFTDETERSNNDSKGYPVYLFDLPKDAVKSIYLGANVSSDTKDSIVTSIRDRGLEVDLYQAKMSKLKYELEFIRVE